MANMSDATLNRIGDALGTKLADEQEKYNVLESQKSELDAEEYNERMRAQEISLAEAKAKRDLWGELDTYVEKTADVKTGVMLAGGNSNKEKDALSEQIDLFFKGGPGASGRNPVEIQPRDLFRAAANQTTSNAPAEDVFASQQVDYILRENVVYNMIPKRGVNVQTFKHLREDTATGKTEVTIAGRAEAAAFGRSDYDTKSISRACVSVGTYHSYTEELLHDDNRRHFLPYIRERLPRDFVKQIETWLISGAGTNNTPTGFLSETGVLLLPVVQNKVAAVTNKPNAVVATASKLDIIDYIADAMAQVETSGQMMPNAIFVHPNDYVDMLKIKDDQKQYQLIFNQVNSPVGGTIPTLWGIPVYKTQAISANRYITMNTSMTALYYMAAMPYRIREGYVASEMLSNIRTVVIDSWLNQYSIRPSLIHVFDQATS